MSEQQPSWEPGRIQKIAIAAIVVVILYTLGGFFLLPPLVKNMAEKKLGEALHRQTVIDQVKINPYLLTCAIDGFTIKNRDGNETWISCKHLFVNLQGVSLFKLAVVCKAIQLTDPYVKITRNENLSYNFSDLLPAAKKTEPEQKQKKPLHFSLNNIQISGGEIDFIDTPRHTHHHVSEINLGLPLISNLPYYLETKVQPSFSAKVNGTPMQLSGATKPFAKSLETSFNVNIEHLSLPFYLAYLPGKRNFTVTNGTLDTRLTLAYAQPTKKSIYLKLSGGLNVKNLVLSDNTSRRFLTLPQLAVEFKPANLLDGQAHLASLVITKPQVEVERQADGALRLPELTLPEKQKKTSPQPSAQKKTNFSLTIDKLSLRDGQLTFLDHFTKPPFTNQINPINLTVSNFSTSPEQQGNFTGSLKSATGESVDVKGDFSLKPARLNGHFGIHDITLSTYFPYYRDYFSGIIEQGSLSGAGDFTLIPKAPDKTIRLDHLSAELKNLGITKDKAKQELINIPSFAISETSIDLLQRHIIIGKLESTAGAVNLVRQQDGRINLQELLPPPAGPPVEKKTENEQQEQGKSNSWKIDLGSGMIDQYQLQYVDHVPSPPVTVKLDHTSLTLKKLTTGKNQLGNLKLSFKLNKNGTFNLSGTLGLTPLAANLSYKAGQVALQPFQAYLNEFFALNITRGLADSSGSLQLSVNDQKKPKITYQGRLDITHFASVDTVKADDFLSWKSLKILGIKGGSQPLSLAIDEIALDTPHTNIIVAPDGSLNLQAMVKKDSSGGGKPGQAEKNAETGNKPAPPMLLIKGITIKNGQLKFLDRSLKPAYAMAVNQLNGSVDHLSSSRSHPAKVNFKAKLNGHAPITIAGTVNPLPKEDTFADLTVTFNDVDLSPFTPYSGKFVGQTISKGKLTLNMHYLVDKTKLSAENHVFLDQFTFGDPVDSPDAVSLPVKLAVALLKNRQGEIKLDLPLQGDMADPQFNLGGIIVKMIFNVISKAVTSPFALLGSIFGGGEDVNHITFDPGSILITPENQKKLAAVGKALHERPGLKLDIQGQVDPDTDRQGLKDARFQHLLKAQKLKKIFQKGTTDTAKIDAESIAPEEYEKYLYKAYKAAPFKKARNAIGLVKKLAPDEMKKLIYDHITITDSDLRLLAYHRAEQVRDYLVKNGPVEAGRIFLTEPKVLKKTPEKAVPGTREVTLIIK